MRSRSSSRGVAQRGSVFGAQQFSPGSVGQSKQAPEEPNWLPGSRYEVLFDMILRASSDLESPISCEIASKGVILLMDTCKVTRAADGGQVERGLVQDVTDHTKFGWCSLKNKKGIDMLSRKVQKESWNKGGRYRVTDWTDLREASSLGSPFIREMMPGEEVVILDFAPLEVGGLVLRVMVHTQQEEVGWTSCQSVNHARTMLDYTDIYQGTTKELAKTMRSGLEAGMSASHSSPPASLSPAGRGRSGSFFGKPTSAGRMSISGITLGKSPWVVEGQYTVLKEQPLRATQDKNGKKVRTVKAGERVTIKQIESIIGKGGKPNVFHAKVECDLEGWISIGWIYCENKEGTALLDVRDHLEFERAQRKLEEIKAQKGNEDTTEEEETKKLREANDALRREIQAAKESAKLAYSEVSATAETPTHAAGWSMMIPAYLREDFLKFVASLAPIKGDAAASGAMNGTAPSTLKTGNGTIGQGQPQVSSFVEDILKLQDMGFNDVSKNFAALHEASSFEGALERLEKESSARYADAAAEYLCRRLSGSIEPSGLFS